jgi:protein phosphatase
MESSFALHAASDTHPGQIRTINQDSVLAFIRERELGPALGLFIVADGMGGHKAGDIASRIAVDTIKEDLSWMLEQGDGGATVVSPSINSSNKDTDELAQMERRLQRAVEDANRAIFEYSQENPEDAGNMGCTVTCALAFEKKVIVANVGDSRAYRWRNGELKRLTSDHSYVWQLVCEGYIEEYEIYDHPQRNVITRALGNQESVEVDIRRFNLKLADRLMLCSDGVWEMIRNQSEMASMVEANPLEKAVGNLIDAANRYGGYDNIGVVIAELSTID